MISTDARAANVLQQLDLKIGHQGSYSRNGNLGEMRYAFRYLITHSLHGCSALPESLVSSLSSWFSGLSSTHHR